MQPTRRALPLCVVCRHLHRRRTGRIDCNAYPLGIPPAILQGLADHREPLCGDGGIRFEPAPDIPEVLINLVAEIGTAPKPDRF